MWNYNCICEMNDLYHSAPFCVIPVLYSICLFNIQFDCKFQANSCISAATHLIPNTQPSNCIEPWEIFLAFAGLLCYIPYMHIIKNYIVLYLFFIHFSYSLVHLNHWICGSQHHLHWDPYTIRAFMYSMHNLETRSIQFL